ncbi:MAG: class I SAM-dependent methyltransferase [Pseudomonadota bacterium]
MRVHKLNMVGFSLTLLGGEHGVGVSFAYSGGLWRRFVAWIRSRRNVEVTDDGQFVGPVSAPTEVGTLQERVLGTYWYHTLDLGHGVVTEGQFDHGVILDRYRLPDDMKGKRVLDVATFDGFWAFEFERRGAAEVVALDVAGPKDCDWPPARLATMTEAERSVRFGVGFQIAKEALGSSVTHVNCNVYDLSEEALGTFDVVHVGDLLPHLNSPVKALQNIASVCNEYALISEVYFPALTDLGEALGEYQGGHRDLSWWRFSRAALVRMVLDAGFKRAEVIADFRYGPRGQSENMHHVVIQAWKE